MAAARESHAKREGVGSGIEAIDDRNSASRRNGAADVAEARDAGADRKGHGMSGWFCAKTLGNDKRATLYLGRAGIEVFRPVIHKYFTNKYQREKMRVLSLIRGYVFVRIPGPAEQSIVMNAVGVAYLLGSRDSGLLRPREMPSQWVTELIDAGPVVQGKKMAFKKGHRVKRAIGRIAEIIGEVEGVEACGKIRISIDFIGAKRSAIVSANELELYNDEC